MRTLIVVVSVVLYTLSPVEALVPYSTAEKQAILDLHNLHRCEAAKGYGGMKTASNMVIMDWDDRACPKVEEQANKCEFSHDSNDNRKYQPFDVVGQNIAYTHSYTSTIDTINYYFREFNFYNWDNKSCTQFYCGHFLQEVYHNTRFICAAKASCQGGQKTSHVVNYAPGRYAGDYMTPGAPCSNCPSGYTKCMDGCLCALPKHCVGKNCTDNSNVAYKSECDILDNKNADNLIPRISGTIDDSAVSASVKPTGTYWFTSNANCTNNSEHCSLYGRQNCNIESVQYMCPSMCQTCHVMSEEGKKDVLGTSSCELYRSIYCTPSYFYYCRKTCNQ